MTRHRLTTKQAVRLTNTRALRILFQAVPSDKPYSWDNQPAPDAVAKLTFVELWRIADCGKITTNIIQDWLQQFGKQLKDTPAPRANRPRCLHCGQVIRS